MRCAPKHALELCTNDGHACEMAEQVDGEQTKSILTWSKLWFRLRFGSR